jgi:uncharacterized phiE125 gp8 family phage protein
MYSYPGYYADGLPWRSRATQLQETNVIVQPTIEPVSLEDFKLHLNYDLNDKDAIFRSYLIAGRQKVEEYIGQYLVDQTLEAYVEDYPVHGYIRLRGPLIGIVAFDYTDTDGIYDAIDDYVVDTTGKAPRLLPSYGATWPASRAQSNSIRIRWRAGFVNTSASPTETTALIPEPLRIAIMFHAQALHERENMEMFIKVADSLCQPYRVDFGIA